MLNKPTDNLTLEEINEELEFAGIERKFYKLDEARKFIIKQIKKGSITMTQEALTQSGIETPNKEKPKERKTPKKEKPVYNFVNTKWEGFSVFTPNGKATITGYDENHARFQVKYLDGAVRDYAEGAVRFKAVDDGYREKYVHDTSIRTESGSASVHCGDPIAEAMLGLAEQEIRSLAVENGLEERYNSWAEKDLNIGMRRMNVGNMLRAKIRRSEPVTIFGQSDLTEAVKIRHGQLVEERKKKEIERKEREKKAAKAEAERVAKAEAKKAAKAEAKKAKEVKKAAKAEAKKV